MAEHFAMCSLSPKSMTGKMSIIGLLQWRQLKFPHFYFPLSQIYYD